VKHAAKEPVSQAIRPLLSLNFFMAGIGPFLGVFLLAHGWASGLIGTVMTAGGVAGMLVAVSPEPAWGAGSLAHTFWATSGFIALTA